MAEVALKVEKRETGRKTAKELRISGKVPGVYYVKGQTGIPITADPMSLRPIVYTAQTKVVKLDIDGEIKNCVLKDISFHPITDQIVHFDLLGLLDDNKVTVPVPFKFIGQSKGVMNGGLFRPVLNKTRISCFPKDLPEFLEIQIKDLEIGKVIRLAKVKTDYPNIDFAVKENPVVCSVARPRVKAE
jgi:large subunit ribosomal protein L25